MSESTLQKYDFDCGQVWAVQAWTNEQVRLGIERLLDGFSDRLPALDAHVVIKPNLNNDLVALTGNSVDLRVLGALMQSLIARGYRRITVADGSNIGVERRNIDTFKRLRVDKMVDWVASQAAGHDIDVRLQVVDLNHDDGTRVVLCSGAAPRVASTVLEADFLIGVPKIKTHVEAGLSCAMKNWVGIARGQDKRHMHYDLARNIFAINEVVLPDLIVVDGLIGMEGNGPGDGEPFRFGWLMASDNAFVNDLVVSRMVDLPLDRIPYLGHAREAGYLTDELIAQVQREVPVARKIQPAPPRAALARLADVRALQNIKFAARPITDRPEVTKLAYRLGVLQDVYAAADDAVERVSRDAEDCGTCEKCADFCPTGLKLEEIGVRTDPESCINCLYCWWVCPKGAIGLEGPLGHLERQVERYKNDIEKL